MATDKDKLIENHDCSVWHLRRKQDEAASDLVDCCERVLIENCYRATRSYRFAALTQGYSLTNLSGYGANVCPSADDFPGLDAPLIKNRLPQMVNSFVSKSFANDSPLPQFTTKGGDYEQLLKAETLDDLIATEYAQEQGAFGDLAHLNRMGAKLAAGATGSYAVWCIDYDNATRPEFELDDTLGMGNFRSQQYGAIRMSVRNVWMLPEEAIRKYGKKHRKAIYKNLEHRDGKFVAGKGVGGGFGETQLKRREVRVCMGWAVQVGKEPGRQMFVLKDGETILRDRVYTKPKPPCVIWHYEEDMDGEWGIPIPQHMYLLSRYQNRILNDVDSSERNTAQVIIATQKGTEGAKAVQAQLVNSKAVQVIEVDGPVDSAMKVFEAPKFSKDSLALEAVYDNAQFEDTGFPRGPTLGGGKAMGQSGIHESLTASYYTEARADAERRSIQCRAIGQAYLCLWVLQSLAKNGYERWVGDKDTRRLVKSTDLDLDEDKYITEIKAVSEGKDSPKSRLEKAEKWLNNPAIPFSGTDMVSMFKTFDVNRLADKLDAIDAWCERQVQRWRKAPISEMQKPDFYQPPERWMQIDALKGALLLVTYEYLMAREQKVPDYRLRWFENFGNETVTLIHAEEERLAKLQQPPAPMGAPAAA